MGKSAIIKDIEDPVLNKNAVQGRISIIVFIKKSCRGGRYWCIFSGSIGKGHP
jgi:hypothetical protein